MQLINTKTLSELNEEGLKGLEAVGFSTDKGSIAKLFLNIINKQIAGLYEVLTVNHLNAFLSTSTHDSLDQIGLLLNCIRAEGESDEDYRYRISKQCKVLASSNETAIRLAALGVSGVTDVFLKPYAYGTGTFQVAILTSEEANKEETIQLVKEAIGKTVAYGIRYDVNTPVECPVTLKLKLFLNTTNTTEAQSIKYEVKAALVRYFHQLSVGSPIVISDITKIVKSCDSRIVNYACVSFGIDGERMLFVDQPCRWFEKFELGQDADALMIE